jgi:transposase
MKAYSLDLRRRVVEAVDNQRGTLDEIAEDFSVSRAFIKKLIKQRRDSNSIAPLPHAGGTMALLDEKKLSILKSRIAEKSDSTLDELCLYLEDKSRIKVSRSTMWRAIDKLGLSHKKNSDRDRAR